ncbi:MAG: lytic murein transglycosylase, partial [Mesorhizobium sp.]
MSVRDAAKRFTSIVAAASLSLALLMPTGSAFADAGFRQWVASFRATAVR